MGVQLFTNGAAATLSGTLAQGGTMLTLAAGTGAKFPSISGSDYFRVTIFTKDSYGVEQNIEVVDVVARTADTLTIVRDVEGITGQSGGYAYDGNATTVYVQLRMTAATAAGFLQKSGNLSGLANASTARSNLGLGSAAVLNAPASGNAAAGEAVKGDDTRLSDARTPTDHNQAASTISDSTVVGRAVLTAADAAAARTAVGAAPIASPTFTGVVKSSGAVQESKVALAAANIDLSSANFFSKTITSNTTLTLSNVPASGTVASFILELTNGGAYTITWWSGINWGGSAPTLTVSGRDVIGFYTTDGGSTWTAFVRKGF